jgi:2,4-dienoyl-CoA reductase-like NADH-dependent reductase (Old Yellow Enzyme family)
MAPSLFSPIELGGLTLPNRIVIAPMCQYSAENGRATDWHLIHLGSLALGGAGLLMLEAAAVEPRGRISPADLGLYDDACEQALARVLAGVRRWGTTPALGIQLAHAGRKASVAPPWQGGGPVGPAAGGWVPAGPSALAFGPDWPVPDALDSAGLADIKAAFVASAERALRLGFDVIELHGAHGYLLHEFLSPLSNHRTDGYGGSRERRQRFPLEVAEAVRAVWPRDRVLGVRVSATDWSDDGLSLDDTIAFVKALRVIGIDYVCVSSGGIAAGIHVPVGPGYQVPLAARIKAETGIVTRAVGMIAEPHQAQAIIAEGKADMVALARAYLDDPHWGWHAAQALGAELAYPPQYERSLPKLWPGHALRPLQNGRTT